MSVTAHPTFVGHKRLHSETESQENLGSISPKRLRTVSSSPPPTCNRRERRAYRVGRTTLATLRSLFPLMEEKVVVEVLDACGNNIDEAIKRLGNLQLSTSENFKQATPPASPPLCPTPPPEPRSETGAEASPSGVAETESGSSSRTPAQWVEGLVQQMAAAKDVNDARVRAANELRSLEQAVIQSTNKARQSELAALQSRVLELSKENHVLKKAVAIQQGRLVEAHDANKQQASRAEGIISQLQSKVHSLEMANYSLSMHLRQATASTPRDPPHPDVF